MRIPRPALFSVLLGALALAAPIVAATDFACLEDCMRQGYGRSYCAGACQRDTGAPALPQQGGVPRNPAFDQLKRDAEPDSRALPPRVDPQCLSDCRARGWKYQLCRQQCSY
ncbi:MAG TPA: hypothetical protein PK375_05205 [Rhodocyclaceae bacterium]|nr:hypothetical protein [Rhodocyclaceae bacterium]HNH35288.1 hypothetical protein [Rhodocyclaceae bacterium]